MRYSLISKRLEWDTAWSQNNWTCCLCLLSFMLYDSPWLVWLSPSPHPSWTSAGSTRVENLPRPLQSLKLWFSPHSPCTFIIIFISHECYTFRELDTGPVCHVHMPWLVAQMFLLLTSKFISVVLGSNFFLLFHFALIIGINRQPLFLTQAAFDRTSQWWQAALIAYWANSTQEDFTCPLW